MKQVKYFISILTLFLITLTVIGCGNKNNEQKEYKEPQVVTKTLGEVRKMEDGVNFKAAYRINVLVSGFGNTLSADEGVNERGNLKITDLEGHNETILLGSTASTSALKWNKKTGEYEFDNPLDFLKNDKTKTIKKGYELKVLVVRDNVDGVCVRGIIEAVIPHEEQQIYKEPRIDAISLKSIMEKADDLNMRFAYKTTVKVAGYGDSEVSDIAPKNAGALKVTDLDGNNLIFIAGSTAERDSLKWNELTGVYEFNLPNDFLKNEVTKNITIGDKLEIIIVRNLKNSKNEYYAIIIGVNHEDEKMLTYANYVDKSLSLMIRKNNTRTRVATLRTDLTDLSKVNVEFFLNNSNAGEVTVVSKIDSSNHYYFGCFVTPTSSVEGKFKLNCRITDKKTGVSLIEVEELEVDIFTSYLSLAIDVASMPIKVIGSAFDNMVTLGYYSFDNSISLNKLVAFDQNNKINLPLIAQLSNGSDTIDTNKVIFSSSDEDIIKIDEKGNFHLAGKSGEVRITVTDKVNSSVNDTLIINVVDNGINISKYDELMEITKNVVNKEYVIVLKDNIMLAPRIETANNSFNYEAYAKSCVTYMNPTTDISYYKNTNKLDSAKIKYAMEISTDIYGNGYAISADNLTQKLYKKYGYRIYRGPLDLVRYNKDYNGGENNLAVKSQDDIIFVVLRDNINITNVELKGCNDESVIDANGNYDLTNLDYCGTVLEIIGNNCNISYSRINNGRTGMRVFGKSHTDRDFNSADYRITTSVSNTLFTNAREFLLKIGTNQIVKNESIVNKKISNPTDEDYLHASPYLTNGTKKYEVNNKNYQDKYFYDNYILNDISIENSVFMNAGLFSIGLDTMFSGLVLHGWDFSDNFKFGSELGWSGIAGTSHPALLRLKGDVRFYDWKKVSAVNSDTLIEGLKDSNGNLSTIASKIGFNLDFSKLLSEYYKGHESILASYEGETYVNGAIAYFGGGKNYSCVAMENVSADFTKLVPYNVSVDFFSPANPRFIYYTAGREDFRFLLYDATSNLSVDRQYNDLSDNSAYDILRK